MNKGQCVTKYYRWIQKNGGYIWIQSSATIAVNAKNNSDKNVIWVNYVLSNPEYKELPLDLAQLPTVPEKTCSSSESEESETEYKEASDNEKSEGKNGLHSEHNEDPEVESKRQTIPTQVHCSSESEPTKRPEEAEAEDGNSSNADSQESDQSAENSENEAEDAEESRGNTTRLTRITGLGALSGIGAISALGSLGGLHIKVEHYGENEEMQTRLANTSTSEEEECEEENDLNESDIQDSKVQKRRKRRKSQPKWERARRIRLSTDSPSPVALGENATLAENLATSAANSPTNSTTTVASSVLKIKTEMAEPINFDNDSSIWNYPPNREISRNEPIYSMTATKPANSDTPEAFPSPQGQSVAIPDSVLTPPGNDGAAGGASVRKTASFNGNSTPSSSASATSLAPLSPPLSASPRDKQQTTPTTSSMSPASSCASSAPASAGSAPSVLYSGDLEALQRLQAGNVVLPLVHRVSGSLAPTSTTAPRVYTTGTIRYAPADVTLAMAQGNLLPNAAVNFVDGSGFGLDPKTPMEMLYHHVHRLNMSAAAAGPFVGASTSPPPGKSPRPRVCFPHCLFPSTATESTPRRPDWSAKTTEAEARERERERERPRNCARTSPESDQRGEMYEGRQRQDQRG
ncbi:hypothetical protein WMY93_033469 [Mugilogobius chulae]|uniref:PAS fold-3 domain-containing protein n=1 Tax=Mugilogobius chulae TaxID=88201 RepID=A0AAW0ML66_9GOBI